VLHLSLMIPLFMVYAAEKRASMMIDTKFSSCY